MHSTLDVKWNKLAAACGTGEIIEVVCLGSTQPGTRRDLQPMEINDHYLRAICLENHELRTFRPDRIVYPDESDSAPKYIQEASGPSFRTVKEFSDFVAHVLACHDWHIESSATRLSVFEGFKNGNPRRNPKVWMGLCGEGYQNAWMCEGRKRRTFASIEQAGEMFLAELGIAPLWAKPRSTRNQRPKNRLVQAIDAMDQRTTTSPRRAAATQDSPSPSRVGKAFRWLWHRVRGFEQ